MTTITRTEELGGERGVGGRYTPLSEAVDWLVSLFLVLTGGVLLYGGAALYWAADRAAIERGVAEGLIVSDVLSAAELVEVTHALAWGGGVGIALTGVLLVAAGVAFHVLESRARATFEETGRATPNPVSTGILGAIVTVLTSFLVLSPIVGGGVAGYLQRRGDGNGTVAGGLAGVFAAVPLVVLFAVIVAAVATGTASLAPLVGFVLVLAVALVVALSALGGYVGGAIAGRKG